MKKLFNRFIAVVLVVMVICTLTACNNTGEEQFTKKGLLVKKDIHGDYLISRYTEDQDAPLTDGVLDIGAILDEMQQQGDITITSDTDVIIKAGAFDNNDNILELIVPAKVTKIDKGAFRNMKALKTLEVPFIGKTVNADAYFMQTGSATDKSVASERTLAHFFSDNEYDEGKPVVIAGNSVYVPYTFNQIIVNATKGHKVIPVGEELPVEMYSIPYEAFKGATNLTKVTLTGDMLVEIGENAFNGCVSLKEIVIPSTVKTIYKEAFINCEQLAVVTIEGTAVELKESVFSGCKAMNKLNSTTEKTIDLTNISVVGENSLDFARQNVTYTVISAFNSDTLTTAFGQTKFN